MAEWTTYKGRSVALLTPEEDAAANQARQRAQQDKTLVEAAFHIQMPFAGDRDKPGTWTAHLGEQLGACHWSILKGGGCSWCDKQRELARIGPLQIDEIVSLLQVYRGQVEGLDKKHLMRLYHRGLAHRTGGVNGWEPTDNGRRYVEAIRALDTIDWVG